MPNSTTPAKFSKPRPDFPLFPHATGRWAKKVRGKFVYFGYCADDPKGEKALELWKDQEDDLLAGRTPKEKSQGLTLRELCDRFMVSKRSKMESGELAPASFQDYYQTCQRIIGAFGKNRVVVDLSPLDFQRLRARMAKGWSPVTLSNEIQRIRVVFHYAEKNCLVDSPIRFGTEFARPSKKVLRASRQAKGKRMFEVDDLRKIIDKAGVPLKAMILCGINAALGNTDCAEMTTANIDLKAGWLDYPRKKTAVPRRCPLWKETIEAIKAAVKDRPVPKNPDDANLVFVTKYGGRWGRIKIQEANAEKGVKASMSSDDPICKEMSKLLKELGLKRTGLNFYALRHTFQTIGGKARDKDAVRAIMGHAANSNDMDAVYDEEAVDDARLKAVVDHVHAWLWPVTKVAKRGTKK